ncbi:MAG: DUF2156 domain-containing protein [Eubacterium sp.]
MLNFSKPTIKDKAWVDKCLRHANSYNCEYSFGNIFIWATAYSTQICHYKDFFICKWGRNKDISYSLPLGEGDFTDAINQIIADAKESGVIPRIYGITDGYLTMLQEAFTGKFTYHYDDGYNDYIYSTEKMASLTGKKYHGKRNHITNFKKNNPNWSFERLNSENIPECIALHSKWIENKSENSENDEDFSLEFEAVLNAFENYDALDLVGGLIRIDGRVIAYTLGEAQVNGRCFVTHFEKAPADIQGAYPIINQEFTKNCLMNYEFVNREEDLGIEGLRRAKQSYYPEIWLKKCVAVYND